MADSTWLFCRKTGLIFMNYFDKKWLKLEWLISIIKVDDLPYDFRKETMSKELWFGKYQRIRLLGEGASSKVYLAVHETLNQYRAIKCISKNHTSYDQVRQEADLLIQLKSPFIPVVYDVEEDDTHLYIIEEFMEGESLLSYRNQTQEVPESIILDLALQICEFIHYLHSMKYPILYLDLKPSNLMIYEGQLKLVDFGVARYKFNQKLGCNYGTRGFAAPEQYHETTLDETSDIYGIGMLLYFLMTGTVRASSGDLPNVMELKGYSKALRQLVAKSMKHNPCERYPCVQSLERKLIKLRGHNRQENSMANTSKKIALIGSEKRTGVTHLAFFLLQYMKANGVRALYVECSPSNVVKALATGEGRLSETIVIYRGCKLTRAEWLREDQNQPYEYIIYDYGFLRKSSLEQFLMADVKIAVLGGKAWELNASTRAIAVLKQDKSVRYVVNHLNALEFYGLAKRMKGLNVVRMPLENDPFGNQRKAIREFVQMIIE